MSFHFHEHIGKRFINQHGDNGINDTFYKGERQIENDKGLDKIIGSRQNGFIHTDNDIHVTARPELCISGIDDKIVDSDTENGHCQSTCKAGDKGSFFGFIFLVDNAGSECEYRTEKEIGKFSHAHGRTERQMYQIFQKAYNNAINGRDDESPYQFGNVGKVEFQERRHQRNGHFDILQYNGNGCQHGSNRNFSDIALVS